MPVESNTLVPELMLQWVVFLLATMTCVTRRGSRWVRKAGEALALDVNLEAELVRIVCIPAPCRSSLLLYLYWGVACHSMTL